MYYQSLLIVALQFCATINAIPELDHYRVQRSEADDTTLTVRLSTIFETATLTLPATIQRTFTPSAPKPTFTATQLYAYREDSPIHLLPIQARGLYFQLGGRPTTACPSTVKDCPPGDITGINGCELSVVVPGGQQIYLKPDGSLRFTASHSVAMAPGSIQCPLIFNNLDDDVSEAKIDGFGATGFMACPMLNSTRVPEQWQVYADLPNATVPIPDANSSTCLGFEAVGIRFYLNDNPAAYGYV